MKLICKQIKKKMPHAFGQTPVVAGLGDPPALGGASLSGVKVRAGERKHNPSRAPCPHWGLREAPSLLAFE